MRRVYKPNLGGFADKLGLKNGIYDLIQRPVPKQEQLYFDNDDINSVKENVNRQAYSGGKNYYRRRGRRR